jgi:hypothetical protein
MRDGGWEETRRSSFKRWAEANLQFRAAHRYRHEACNDNFTA